MKIPVGVDEAGRGAIAGPVVAASFPLIEALSIPIKDSKKMEEKRRERIFNFLIKEEIPFGVGVVSNEFIDREGIVRGTFEAMRLSLLPFLYKKDVLKVKEHKMVSLEEFFGKFNIKGNFSLFFPRRFFISNIIVLVDGNSIFTEDLPLISMVKGDEKIPLISFASVVAKVVRDRIMRRLSKEFNEFLWERNKGYATESHIRAVEKFGITIYHRKTFKIKRGEG